MVVNEVTSSVQAKGTKTVVAAAVATMIAGVAGSAMAEATPTEVEGTVTVEGTLTVEKDKYTASEDGVKVTIDEKTDKWGNHKLTANSAVVLKNGTLQVNAKVPAGDDKTGASTTVNVKDVSGDTGTIVLTSYGNGTDKDGLTSTLSVAENVNLKSGTIAFKTANKAQKVGENDEQTEKTTLAVTKDLALGVASNKDLNEAGKSVDMTVDANTNAVVTAKKATLTNVAIDNAGSLSITVSAPAENTAPEDGALVLGKDSTISNSGKLALAGKTVAFNADYTEGEKGTLFLKGTDSVAIAGTVKGSNIAFSSDTVKDATITINGGTTGTTITGSVEATGTMTLGTDAKVTNKGDLTAAKTEVNASDVTLTNALIKTVKVNGTNKDVFGSISLGELTVTKDGALTISNNDKEKAVTASKVIVKKEGESKGSLTIAQGGFETVALDNAGIIVIGHPAVESPVQPATVGAFVLTGEGKNAGKFNFVDVIAPAQVSTLKVGAESVLSNTKEGVIGKEDTHATGKLVVDGKLNNLGKIGVKEIEVNGLLDNQKETTGDKSGSICADTLTIAKAGVLNAGVAYIVDTTDVYGTYNALKLDNKVGTGNDDALTILNAINLYEGAQLNAAGAAVKNVVLGKTGDDNEGILTIKSGAFEFDTVKNGNANSSFNVEAGSATVKELNSALGTATVAAKGELTVTDVLTTTANTNSVTADGALNVSLKSIGYKVEDNKITVLKQGATATTKDKSVKLGQSGVLTLTDFANAETTVKLNKFDQLTAILTDDSLGLIDLGNVTTEDLTKALVNGKIKQSDLTTGFKNVTTTALKSAIVTDVDAAFTTTQNLGKVELKAAATSTDKLEINGSTLTLNNDGAIVTYSDGKTVAGVKFATPTSELVTTGTSEVGALDGTPATSGTPNNGVVTVKSNALTVKGNVALQALTVNEGAALNIEQVADTTKAHTVNVADATINGAFNAAQNTVTADEMTINGSAVIGVLAAGSDVTVGNKEHAATLSLGELASDADVTVGIAADDWKKAGDIISRVAVKTNKATHSLTVQNGSIVAVGTSDLTAADAALAKTGFTVAPTFVTAPATTVDSFDTRTVNSFVAVYGNASGEILPVTGHIEGLGAANSMLYVDGNTVDKTGVIGLFATQSITFQNNSVVFFDNVTNGDVIKVTNSGTIDGRKPDMFFEGDMLMHATFDDEGKLSFAMDDRADIAREIGDIVGFDAAYGMFEEGKNLGNDSASAKFNKWLYTSLTTPVLFKSSEGEYELDATKLKKITSEVGALGATSGVQTVTLDAVNMMADTAAARTSILNQKAEGAQVWADVNGGSFEAKKLFNGAGYSSDIWAGSIGVDYTAACGGTLGAALTIGTADTDSKNTGVVSSTDSDLVGFTVYASQTFNDVLGVALDLGYLKASNDVTANGYEQAWNYSQDTDAFTFGVRGEVLTKVGSVNIVPHAGLRWTRITTDDFEAGYTTDVSTMNVFQLPLGVTVSGEFEAASWTLAPKFDLSVVPAFGDKDAELKLGIAGVSATDDLAVRVVDSNPVQATLGLSATNGAWAFGLNYKLGVATDSRMNNTFNANVRYAF